MDTQAADVLNSVAGKTQSELILFFILIVVALVIFLLPLYRMIMKDKNTRQDKYIEREKRIIEVITANTEIMAGLKATLETSGAATSTSLERIHDRIDSQTVTLAALAANMAQIQAALDRSIDNQTAMLDEIREALLIVDSLPPTGSIK